MPFATKYLTCKGCGHIINKQNYERINGQPVHRKPECREKFYQKNMPKGHYVGGEPSREYFSNPKSGKVS